MKLGTASILSVLLIPLFNCAVGFLSEMPNANDNKSEQCFIRAIDVKYHSNQDYKVNQNAKTIVTGYHSELIKQFLKDRNIYCDSSKSQLILNIDINENSYNRIAGIKSSPEISGLIYGFTLSIIPISTHIEYRISAKIGESNKIFKSSGKNMTIASILLFPIAPFAKPSDKHKKLIESIIGDICEQMIVSDDWNNIGKEL